MDRQRKVEAILSTKVVMSKGEYIEYLLNTIIAENTTLQHALESDKFHVVGACAARMEDAAEDLKLALDV